MLVEIILLTIYIHNDTINKIEDIILEQAEENMFLEQAEKDMILEQAEERLERLRKTSPKEQTINL